jgi:hypothetical protein
LRTIHTSWDRLQSPKEEHHDPQVLQEELEEVQLVLLQLAHMAQPVTSLEPRLRFQDEAVELAAPLLLLLLLLLLTPLLVHHLLEQMPLEQQEAD